MLHKIAIGNDVKDAKLILLNIPEAESIARNLCRNVSETFITDCSPNSVVFYLQTSTSCISLGADESHYIETRYSQDISGYMCSCTTVCKTTVRT